MNSALPRLRPFDPLRFTKRVVSAIEFRELVAAAAYFRAEARHFVPGYEFEDWLAAEREVAEQVIVAGPTIETAGR